MKKSVAMILVTLLIVLLAALAFADSGWQAACKSFVSSGDYARSIHAADPTFTEIVFERDTAEDRFAVCDINNDGVPELIVMTVYGVEQADVFAFENGTYVWKGTMGGDNFFQAIVSYAKAGLPGAVYALMGGPAMRVEEYKLVSAGLVKWFLGQTLVDDDGMTLPSVSWYEDAPGLEPLLVKTLSGNWDGNEFLDWYSFSELQGAPGWSALFDE